ncbi:glycoprotein-N-acetylgalactosamine 3-beta-galactosyltransferase 1-like [Ptychodera flava]|uniref:glycoprotein-N-acetylgalactosamine 3-beta-galactosyltransferase 1-like n=1 Tax=Ptychodera flava TaxID=63121 RepID=UPI003969E62D
MVLQLKKSVAFVLFLCLQIVLFLGMNRLLLSLPRKCTETSESTDLSSRLAGRREPHIKEASLTDKEPVRILCFIPTTPDNGERLTAVRETWGKRVDKMLFLSSETNQNQTIISLNVTEGRHFLWGKVKAAFKYIYKHHINDADWFMKADDDTYVIVENLRKMLERENTTQLMLFGDRVKNPNNLNVTHADGGAGYVISKATLRKLVEVGLKNASLCSQREQGNEDVTMSRCLERLGVPHRDSRDDHGKHRFFRISVEMYFDMSVPKYKRKIEYYPTVQGKDCCSENLVSMHKISPSKMYMFDYLLYKVRPQSQRC